MSRLLSARPHLSWILAASSLLAAQPLVAAQIAASDERVTPTLISGRVVGPQGAPVAGAVVVTSLGGQAVTDAAGAFSLELALAAGADDLRVTAVAGSGATSLVGSLLVSSLAPWGTTDAGTVVLAQSTDCEPSWLPTFGQAPGIGAAGVSPGISALAVFDDGDGPALYAGGGMPTAGGVPVNHIARWDGTYWSALDGGVSGPGAEVNSLAVFDDGTGEALYAGGSFTTAGGVPASRIARWNGASWSAVGGGFNQVPYALAVFDEGGGPALFAGGDFTMAGGTPVSRIARWNGASWSAVGSGLNERVLSLAVFEDGFGPVLVAGGTFTGAGAVPASRIAQWNGTSWSALGVGVDGPVWTMLVHDDGGGEALFVGGQFLSAGGLAAPRVARWDTASWSALGTGMNSTVRDLAAFDDGGGMALYASGQFTSAGGLPANRLAKWDGSAWSALDTGMNGDVRALAVFDAGAGPALVAGGAFTEADGLLVRNVASWDGSDWSMLGTGPDGVVMSLAVFDDGDGPALYAGGSFELIGGLAANKIAKWDGSTWSPLGTGVSAASVVMALATFDDGNGEALYAGGNFVSIGGVAVSRIAKWDGTSWSDVGGGTAAGVGLNPDVRALAVFDDGDGPALYAGGGFTIAGGVPAKCIAKWDGASWSAVGLGIEGGTTPRVLALEVFDDGGGAALYAGGEFTQAGHAAASRIAKWDGSIWTALGSGLGGTAPLGVHALAVFDDGGGPGLYAGGRFTIAGGVAANHVARWDGSSWSALGDGVAGVPFGFLVETLETFDAGRGPALHAGGNFTSAGLQSASRIARWDGASWTALDSGVNETVLAMTVFDAGAGPSLFVGGEFGAVLDSHDSFLGQWGGCAGFPYAWTDLGGGLGGLFGLPILIGTGELGPGTPGSLVLTNSVGFRPAMLFVSAASAPAPFKCGTLVPIPSLLQLPLITDGFGNISLAWASWPSGLSGLSLYFQFAIKDPAAICGVSISNALRGDVP